jgi:ankyrin repeat protein
MDFTWLSNDAEEVLADEMEKAISGRHYEQIKTLVHAGANPDHQEANFGMTPLIMAAIKGDAEFTRILLEKGGLDLERKNGHGNTALKMAIMNKHTPVVRLLVDAGAEASDDCRGYAEAKSSAVILQILDESPEIRHRLADEATREKLRHDTVALKQAAVRAARPHRVTLKGHRL